MQLPKPPKTGCKRKDVVAGLWDPRAKSYVVFSTNSPIGGDPKNCTGEVGGCGCIHAEIAMVVSFRPVYRKTDYELHVNFSPCLPCVQAIVAARYIAKVVWNNFAPHHPRAPALLRAAGILTEGPEA